MTPTLSDATLDRVIAEKVMGWYELTAIGVWFDRDPRFAGGMAKHMANPDWSPTTRIQDAWAMEEKIKEMCKQDEYAANLMEMLNAAPPYGRPWAMAHAAPLDRVKAAIKTLGIEIQGAKNAE